MDRPLVKINIRIYEDDLALLRKYFPKAGYNRVVREAIHKLVLNLEERTNQVLSEQSPN